MLERISGTSLVCYLRRPKQYAPGDNVGITDLDDDVGEKLFVLREPRHRLGGTDLRWEHLRKDTPACAHCGILLDGASAHGDHIVPVRRFASFREAHQLENMQLLCHGCHKAKTIEDFHNRR